MGRVFVIGLAVLLGAAQAFASTQLVQADGEVWVTPPKGAESVAKSGQELAPGTKIRTGSSGRAELRFENGSTLKVRPNTTMSLSAHKRRQAKKSSVMLFFGRLWSKVTKTDDRGFEIKTANAVCGVRGTEFETAVADDGSVQVRVEEGEVGVGDGLSGKEQGVGPGTQVDASGSGVGEKRSQGKEDWNKWEADRKERLRKNGKQLVGGVKSKIAARKAEIERLRAEQKGIEAKRKGAEDRAKMGDKAAITKIKEYNLRLATIADRIADLGDQAESQFGLVDRFADLASDPRFNMIDRKYLIAEAESLRRIKKNLDAMVADGTDISVEAMDKMMDDMSHGDGGLLDDKSAADDLFGPMK